MTTPADQPATPLTTVERRTADELLTRACCTHPSPVETFDARRRGSGAVVPAVRRAVAGAPGVIWVRGVEYGTAAAIAQRFRVTVWTVYKWRKLHGLSTTRINGRDYSSVVDAAAIDLAMRDATRGRARHLDTVTLVA